MSSAGSIAAVIVEPMQGTAGNVIPPKEFLPAVRDMAHDLGALLIADEMITGLGRTGRNFGVDHSGVVPDIMTVGKAFGGGFPAFRHRDHRRDLRGQAVEQSLGLVVELRRQSAGRHGRGQRAEDHRGRAAGGELGPGWRGHVARAGEASWSAIPSWAACRARACSCAWSWSRTRPARSRCRGQVTERIFHECVRRGLLTMAYAANFRIQPALTMDEATAKNGLAVAARGVRPSRPRTLVRIGADKEKARCPFRSAGLVNLARLRSDY